MTFTLGLLASSASEIDWSRPLMIGWIVVALGLGLLEIWLAGGFSSRRLTGQRIHEQYQHTERAGESRGN